MHATKRALLEAGLELLLERGYADLGIQTLLKQTGVPKGSFYHHFDSKEDFALQVVDLYMAEVHEGLQATMDDPEKAPLEAIRSFFEGTKDKYARDGYLGCMLGGLGQELSGVNPRFAERIDGCLETIGASVARCLHRARAEGELSPSADPDELAERLIDCWEGAALRSRLRRSPKPLGAMLDFYFGRLGA